MTGMALSCVAPAAFAADCDALGLPNPIYGAGGSAETGTIKAVATYFAGLVEHPITVLWHDPGACDGYQQYLDNAITSTAVKYWSAEGAPRTCTATARAADFSHMVNDHDFCVKGGLTLPSGYPTGFATTLAPVQTLNIIVDKDSSQESISAEALYYVFGFGAGAEGKRVTPWTNPAHIVTRNPTSFASQMLADAIFGDSTRVIHDDPGQNGEGPGPNGRLGVRTDNVINTIAALGNADPESPIGYAPGLAVLADATAAGGRKVKVLAYQHFNQACGVWPDSTESAWDKLNVRTGKYALWAPGHFYYRVDSDGRFANPNVETFIQVFVGSHDEEVLGLVIDNGDVPLCAMQVTREGLSGAVSSVAPDDPCGCYFESRVAGTAQCSTCREGHKEDCSEPGAVCRRGYCEAY